MEKINYTLKGEFKNSSLFTGSITGDIGDNKDFCIEFKEGKGFGGFRFPWGRFEGGWAYNQNKRWTQHGKGRHIFDNGDIKEIEYNMGVVEHILMYNEEEDWRYEVSGQFEGYTSDIVNGFWKGSDNFYTYMDI